MQQVNLKHCFVELGNAANLLLTKKAKGFTLPLITKHYEN
jgi:hypothetical protein